MLGDGAVKEAARAGCWGSCHDDAMGMAISAPDGRITKYLAVSRTKLSRQGGGEDTKSPAELQALIQQGTFLEYWQARLNPDRPAEPASGYVLDKRHRDAQASTRAEASFTNGEWAVVLSRPLKSAAPTQKALIAGKPYAIGFAIHDDYTDHRFHYVSLELSLMLDAGIADFVAKPR
ncbi:MAG: ethylbenzene dehydrogenase-related protein [Gammaproteobacteria bacterium]